MPIPILATKLFIPPPRPGVVPRARLIERLNDGLANGCKLTLISAPAGFGKTTLISAWAAGCGRSERKGRTAAWLSLDEGDRDLARFVAYLITALQTIRSGIGEGLLNALQSPQVMQPEAILTSLLNEISAIPDPFILILDDYHTIDSRAVDLALTFLVEHLPPQMHLVINTREDPTLPLARLRARGHLSELRTAELRFTPSETADFLNRAMGLNLSYGDIATLEARTEGWIAGLQMAALALQSLSVQGVTSTQGPSDAAGFIQSFTGSHRFVLDYLLEEVLQRQPTEVQTFLLRTSIISRLCGPLCDAVLGSALSSEPVIAVQGTGGQETAVQGTAVLGTGGQKTLEYLEHANLFIVPLDNERRWYRYHQLFADLLRQRLGKPADLDELYLRASWWHEQNGLDLEAFQYAAAANDIDRAERLIDEKGLQLHFRGIAAIRNWLETLPAAALDARPSLWIRYAAVQLWGGQATGVEEKLQAAEAGLAAALQGAEPDNKTRALIGQIATSRATLALTRYQLDGVLAQSRRALAYLPPGDLLSRFSATWTMGMAFLFQGERDAAGQAFTEALALAHASGNVLYIILAMTCLGQIYEMENRLYLAAETYREVLQLVGDYSPPNVSEVYLGLARLCYEWNDLEGAEQYGLKSLQLARQYDRVIDRFILSEVFLARLKLAKGDLAGAAAMLTETEQSVHQLGFEQRISEVADARVLVMLRQGQVTAAGGVAQAHPLPMSQARVYLAQGNPSAALAVLAPLREQVETRCWQDERLKVMVLEAAALNLQGNTDQAVQLLADGLATAEAGGFIRTFVDEGLPMLQLLREAASHESMARHRLADYIGKLVAAFDAEAHKTIPNSRQPSPPTLIDPLSPRELEVLRLIAQGLSNQAIGERLFLALDTVKGHNRRIFEKLQVQRRTEAIARARELGLL